MKEVNSNARVEGVRQEKEEEEEEVGCVRKVPFVCWQQMTTPYPYPSSPPPENWI